MQSICTKRFWGKNVLTLNPHIHQKSQKISNYYINDQTLLRIIKLLYKRTTELYDVVNIADAVLQTAAWPLSLLVK
jgi:hypothetical protein